MKRTYLKFVEISTIQHQHSVLEFAKKWRKLFAAVSYRVEVAATVALHLLKHFLFVSSLQAFVMFESIEFGFLISVNSWRSREHTCSLSFCSLSLSRFFCAISILYGSFSLDRWLR